MSLAPPVIAGVGLVTPLGRTGEDTWRAVIDGRHITNHTRLAATGRANLPRVSALAVEAARQAVQQAGWALGTPGGVVVCTSKGPVEDWIAPPEATSDKLGRGVAFGSGERGFGMACVAADVDRSVGLGPGPRLTVSAACAGGLHALARAALLIRSGEADRVLVVAAEASAHPLFIGSFDRLGVLAPPGELCRPFDVDRRGFLMSEAAAAVCLQAHHLPRADTPAIAVTGYALGSDAANLTGVDRSGRVLARLIGLATAGETVDLVHAHGTGTGLNDEAELAALAAGLPDAGTGATLLSHKAALGHTLGASGLVSVVLSCLAHRRSEVPPNANTRRPMPTRLSIASDPVRRDVRRSLVCAAGFGGGLAALTLQTT